jgi:predicted transposase YbfD/YdcC
VVHGITSLSEDRADAARLLELVRSHWRVENQLHYVRDVTLGEDSCRVRSGDAPQVLAAMRNAVICLLSRQLGESHTDVIERLAARPDRALNILSDPTSNSL